METELPYYFVNNISQLFDCVDLVEATPSISWRYTSETEADLFDGIFESDSSELDDSAMADVWDLLDLDNHSATENTIGSKGLLPSASGDSEEKAQRSTPDTAMSTFAQQPLDHKAPDQTTKLLNPPTIVGGCEGHASDTSVVAAGPVQTSEGDHEGVPATASQVTPATGNLDLNADSQVLNPAAESSQHPDGPESPKLATESQGPLGVDEQGQKPGSESPTTSGDVTDLVRLSPNGSQAVESTRPGVPSSIDESSDSVPVATNPIQRIYIDLTADDDDAKPEGQGVTADSNRKRVRPASLELSQTTSTGKKRKPNPNDETEAGSSGALELPIRIKSLKTDGEKERPYTWDRGTNWGFWKSTDLSLEFREVDLASVDEVVVGSGSGYRVDFVLRRNKSRFQGPYGENGKGMISVDPEELEAMLDDPLKRRFVAHIVT